MALEKIAGDFRSTQGPVFSRLGYLLFSDVPANRIYKWMDGAITVFRENSNGAGALTFDHQGRLLTCEADRVTRTEKDGTITVLAARFQGRTLNGPSDLVYAIDGCIYFSDPPGGVHQILPRGGLRVVSRESERPTGVALAPNQQQLYVSDSSRRNIRVHAVEADGALREGRIFCELRGAPGGLKTDEGGNVWVTMPGGIWLFDRGGKHLRTIEVPETPSNCGWGDGFRTLYITAGTSVYRIPTEVHGTRTY